MTQDLSRLFRRVQHAIRPARISAPTVESGEVQRAQVQFNDFETRELNSVQLYGLASAPLPGCDAMIINVSGDGSNGCIIGTNDQRHRPRHMTAGSVRIYNDAGSYVHIEGGTITIVAATRLDITTPEVTMSGKLTVAGDIVSTGGDVKAGSTSLQTHRHGGVQPGGGQTGTPV